MLEVPFARRVLDGSTDVSIVDDDFEIVRIAAAKLLCSKMVQVCCCGEGVLKWG